MASLGTIATVRMGVTLRGRDATRPDPNGSCRMIRIGDLSDDGGLATTELFQFEPGERIKSEAYLRAGDVLFPNRGTRTTAHVFDSPLSNVIVGAQLFIIRPDPQVVIPEFLAWYLRSEIAAKHFQSLRKGTLVQTLQRGHVEILEIPVPTLAKQSAYVELDRLSNRERTLSSRLAALRSLQIQRTLLQALPRF